MKDEALKMAKAWFEANTYGDEAAEVYEAIEQALAAPVQEPVALAQEVIGCFYAAEIEGLTAALANTSDLHLKYLVGRRLMHALYAAQEFERNFK
jgi:hypothetical protein